MILCCLAWQWEIRDADLFDPISTRQIAVSSEGAIYIAHYFDKTVLMYDAKGIRLGNFGREGSGPGEFQSLSKIKCIEDTIFTVDSNQRRVTKWTLDGQFIHAVKSPIPYNRPEPVRNGHVLDVFDQERNERRLVLTDSEMNELAIIAMWSVSIIGMKDNAYHFNPVNNMGSFFTTPDGRQVIYAPPDRLEIHCFDVGTKQDKVIYSETVALIPFDEVWGQEQLQAFKKQITSFAVKPRFPDYFPPYSAISFAGTGHIYVGYWSAIKDPSSGKFLGLDGTLTQIKADIYKTWMVLWSDDQRAIVQYTDNDELVLANIDRKEIASFQAEHTLKFDDEK